jgi:hypothetical protein
MLLRLLFFLLLLPALAFAQKGKPHYGSFFNSDSFWHSLVQEPPLASNEACITEPAIIVASNRKPAAGVRFMSEARDEDSLRFYFVFARGGKWHVARVPGLRAAVAHMQCDAGRRDRDWVIYTEGMGKIFATDLNRAFSMAKLYEVNVLLLDYPSIRSDRGNLRNFYFARASAKQAACDFLPVLDSFRRLRSEGLAGNARLTLFFHSLGNQVMRELALGKGLGCLNDAAWVDNLVLNAPCVPRRNAAEWIDKIAFARRIFIHYNPHDATLKWARIASFHAILGERPTHPLSRKVQYVNFNLLCDGGHSNFLSLHGRRPAMPEAIDYYRVVLHGEAPDPKVFTNLKRSCYYGIGKDIWPQM